VLRLLTILLLLSLPARPQAWRDEANARIEKIRKGELSIQVVDKRGRPVPNARVHVRLTRHAFGWGAAIAAQQLLAATPDAEKYRQAFLDNFNMAVFENDLKWPQWEQNRRRALDGIQWLRSHGITRIRGHNLVWPSWRWTPQDLPALQNDPAALRARVLTHIQDTVSATRGLLEDWDVLNEPYTNHDLIDILGAAEMAAWFKQAREFDPRPRLFLNDFDILSAGKDTTHPDNFYQTLEFLTAQGAPIEGIGMQGHFSAPAGAGKLLATLDRFSKFGLPIRITEFDFDTSDEKTQAEFTRDLLTICFSHPRVDAFLMWGFWEGRHWRPRGAMLRRDWSPKPNYEVWRDLVHKQWWTDTTAATAADGTVKVRAFLGDYTVEVPGAPPAQAKAPGAVRVTLP
jgi:GH35 family endo-1,4-beta-xylanase